MSSVDAEKELLEYVNKLILEIENEQSEQIPASYLDLDPTIEVSDHESDNEDATEGYEDVPVATSSSNPQQVDSAVKPVETWCTCGRCENMPTEKESYCCDESEMVAEIRQDFNCVTEAEQFCNLIESKDTLKYSRYLMSFQIDDKSERKKYMSEPLTNTMLRYLSYRTFVSLVNCHQSMGKWNRVTLPACVVSRIRYLYPDPNENYTGYSSDLYTNVLSFKDM